MLRYALVGCGRISGIHLDAVARHYKENKIKLVALCDIMEEKALLAKESYISKTNETEVNCYSSMDEMLDKEELDVIAVCTPSGMHPEHGIKAAKKGIHVLTEKPMGCDLEEVDNLIKACEENNVKLFVVKQNRLNPTCSALIEAVDANRFGKIYMVQSNVYWYRGQNYYNSDDWRGTWKLDGGAFMNQAVHYADLVQRVGGNIKNVSAFIDHLGRKIEAEDTGSAIIRFENGAIGNMNVTMLTSIGDYEGSLTVIGEKGFVKLGGLGLNKILEWKFDEEMPIDKDITNLSYHTTSVYGFGHVGVYANLIDSIDNGASFLVDGYEGRKSVELVLAIYESAKENKVVTLS